MELWETGQQWVLHCKEQNGEGSTQELPGGGGGARGAENARGLQEAGTGACGSFHVGSLSRKQEMWTWSSGGDSGLRKS